jgi:hypothetical protein
MLGSIEHAAAGIRGGGGLIEHGDYIDRPAGTATVRTVKFFVIVTMFALFAAIAGRGIEGP